MSLQVEHTTEKGTVLFVKVPDDAREFSVKFGSLIYYCDKYIDANETCVWHGLQEGNWQLIALTSEVTEEMAKMMLPKPLERKTEFGIQYGYMLSPMETEIYICALDAFRALMQFKKVYETNPLPMPEFQDNVHGVGGYNQEWVEEYEKAQKTTGTWLTLFKPND